MSDKINLKDMERRANRLLSQDGLIEILLGAIFFVSSASFSTPGSWVPFLPIYIIYLKNIMEGFRKRFTYPRIGYVKMPEDMTSDAGTDVLKYLGVAMAAFIIGILLVFGRPHASLLYKMIPTGIGVFLSGALYYMYTKTGDRINWAYIAVIVLGGLAFSQVSILEGKQVIQFYTLFVAIFFIVSGIVRLIVFTRKNPVLEAPSDE